MGPGEQTSGPARLVDVAREAGVSLPSVTRVLHGSAPVSDAMRDRVLAAVATLNYHPNQAARALKIGSSSVISVVLSETTRHGYAATLQGVEEAARTAGYSVLIVIVEDESPGAARRAVDLSVAHSAAGVVVLEFDRAGENVLGLVPRDLATVSVGSADPRPRDAPHAYIDDHLGARDAVHHLLDLGHETVHMVAIPGRGQPSARVAGWAEALAGRGAPRGLLLQAAWGPESGYAAAQRLLDDEATVTAVLCGNDELAFGVIRGLQDAGREVPGQVSVVGFDDIPLARFWAPALTTVRQDFVALGHRSFALLHARLEDRPVASTARAEAPLVVRQSSGPPP
ncbi:LacI family DNA-binding transcriptional regulator [Microlunatus antarcticus]|uniref:DNA-binding LacI/PurR family transcriptional regulator n=1 Tax=Microlunatus antarcticus TaxID=53388 RepID=A0A7W5P7F6_9ACTN|nr:DNA-binding LacI/PurR family transcriptional regulator [Microlunatus antarcticus]